MTRINSTIHNQYKIVIHQNFHACNENDEWSTSAEVQVKRVRIVVTPSVIAVTSFFITRCWFLPLSVRSNYHLAGFRGLESSFSLSSARDHDVLL